MARKRKIKPVPKGQRKPLYPRGWPGNLRAVLYLNNRKRLQKLKEDSDDG